MVKRVTTSMSLKCYTFMKENQISPSDVIQNHLYNLMARETPNEAIIKKLNQQRIYLEKVISKIPYSRYLEITKEIERESSSINPTSQKSDNKSSGTPAGTSSDSHIYT